MSTKLESTSQNTEKKHRELDMPGVFLSSIAATKFSQLLVTMLGLFGARSDVIGAKSLHDFSI